MSHTIAQVNRVVVPPGLGSGALDKEGSDHTEFMVLALQQYHVYRKCILRLSS